MDHTPHKHCFLRDFSMWPLHGLALYSWPVYGADSRYSSDRAMGLEVIELVLAGDWQQSKHDIERIGMQVSLI